MADRKLNSITFPDIDDRYILDADNVNYDATETYKDGSVGKALGTKAEVDGRYENLTAGNALQLESTVRENDQTPYVFRTSGGSVDIGDREYINGIVGGTVAWNQLVPNAKKSGSVQTDTSSFYKLINLQAGVPIDGHVYFTSANVKYGGTENIAGAYVQLANGNTATLLPLLTNSYQRGSALIKCTVGGTNKLFRIGLSTGVSSVSFPESETFEYDDMVYIDLTQMFGTTIADYIYSLEQSNAGAGVAWFKKLFPKPYYEYNAGELKSVSGLVSHDMTGFNQWDEEWELGNIDSTDGTNTSSTTRIRSKNYIPVLPNTKYYFKSPANTFGLRYYDANKTYIGWASVSANSTKTLPDNCWFLRFTVVDMTTYNHDICINLSWDGSRDGEYEEYELHSYPFDSTLELSGIPKLDSANNLYYDGDVYEADGTVTRRYGIVTYDGSIDEVWSYESQHSQAYIRNNNVKRSNNYKNIIISNKLVTYEQAYYNPPDYGVSAYASNSAYPGENWIYIKNVDVTSKAEFLAWLASNPITIVYELATPTEETADPYNGTQIVNDFGTEEYVFGESAFPIPVGHNTDYPIDLKAKVEMAPNSPDGDGDYIVRQTNGMNEYVPLIIEDALPTIPSTAGSYKLTVTVAEGSDPVLSWEEE